MSNITPLAMLIEEMRDEVKELRSIEGGMAEEMHNQFLADRLDFYADRLSYEILVGLL